MVDASREQEGPSVPTEGGVTWSNFGRRRVPSLSVHRPQAVAILADSNMQLACNTQAYFDFLSCTQQASFNLLSGGTHDWLPAWYRAS